MIPDFATALKAAKHAVGQGVRDVLWRAGLLMASAMAGTVGCGFLVFAGYAALRHELGPELAALITGLILLALAGGLVLIAQRGAAKPDPLPPARVSTPQPAATPSTGPPPDPATLAVFTAAFVLGRRLAARLRD